MQDRNIGGIGDFGKLALLRHLMKDRRLAVCWYPTGGNSETSDRKTHFDYLMSIGIQLGPRIGIQKGPPFPTF